VKKIFNFLLSLGFFYNITWAIDFTTIKIPEAKKPTTKQQKFINLAKSATEPQDRIVAYQLLENLGQEGIVEAQSLLGKFYQEDNKEESALKWSYIAAQNGSKNDKYRMAKLFYEGKVTDKDIVQAKKWLQGLNSLRAIKLEEKINAELVVYGEDLIKEKQYQRAYTILKPIGNSGDLKAQLFIADMFDKKQLKETYKAKYWYGLAAKQGSKRAQLKLATTTLTKSKNKKNLDKAKQKLLELADPGLPMAQFELGKLYATGEGGFEKDMNKAVKWYRIAAEQDHVEAQYTLGVRYYLGKGVDQNNYESHAWFKRAAKQGHSKSQHNLGVSYFYGIGTDENKSKAYNWFEKAAEGGVKKSKFYLKNRTYQPESVAQLNDDIPVKVAKKEEPKKSKPTVKKEIKKEVQKPVEKVAKKEIPKVEKKKEKKVVKKEKVLKKERKKTKVVEKKIDNTISRRVPIEKHEFKVLHNQEWFKNLDEKSYSILLVSGYSLDTIQNFINREKLKKDEYMIYYAKQKGKTGLYVVVDKNFDGFTHAKKYLYSQNRSYRVNKPWIVNIKKLKSAIKRKYNYTI
jgi:TPR repeat protein